MNAHTSTAVPTAADIRILEKGLIGIGVAMGTAVLIVKAAEGRPWALAAGMALYGVMILGATLQGRRATAVPAAYGRLVGMGVAGSSALYAAAVALQSAGLLTWDLTLLAAMLTMTPCLLAAHTLSKQTA